MVITIVRTCRRSGELSKTLYYHPSKCNHTAKKERHTAFSGASYLKTLSCPGFECCAWARINRPGQWIHFLDACWWLLSMHRPASNPADYFKHIFTSFWHVICISTCKRMFSTAIVNMYSTTCSAHDRAVYSCVGDVYRPWGDLGCPTGTVSLGSVEIWFWLIVLQESLQLYKHK